MKKFIGIICVALSVCIGSLLTSCGGEKSNMDLINEYKELCSEVSKAIKNGDTNKIPELSKKGEALEKEINERELTDEEKAEFIKITNTLMSEFPEGAAGMMEGL